eukprot:107044_1
MADNKYEEDYDTTDDEINDGYKPDNMKKNLLATSNRGFQQNHNDPLSQSSPNTLEKVNRSNDIDEIQNFIGQIAIIYKDLPAKTYYYGTGTNYKHVLSNKYYIILTCAHNLLRRKNQPAVKIFYLPQGMKQIESNDEKKESNKQTEEPRLECISWRYYPKYNPELMHCANDIGLILCYDGCKYYKKLKLQENVNELIDI